MALVLKDRVKETTTTTGTGSFALAGAVTGYDSFGQIGNGNTTYYAVYLDGGSEWEVGIGTYTAPSTLSRDTILASSNAGSVVTFSAGQKTIWCDYPAGKAVYLDAAGSISEPIVNISGITGAISTVDTITFDTGYTTTLTTGQLGWDGNNTLGLGMSGGNIVQEIGLQNYIYGKATSAITKGQLIKKTGSNGSSGVITFAPTTANMTDSGAIIGIAAENIALNGFGYVISSGNLKGFNTTGSSSGETWADGDVLYYSPAGNGLMTKTKPSAPNMKTEVAIVINAGSGGSGSVAVEIIHGTQLGGTDSNVQINGVTGGQLLSYDQTNGYWKNTNLAAGTGITVNSATGGTITVTNAGVTQATAGTGISVSAGTGNVTITNTAPDQTVSLTGGTGISTTGTYPNFTITNTAPDQTVVLTAGTGISTSGTYPNFTITNTSLSSGGTVTNVATGTGLTGGPITTTGTISLANTAVTPASYTYTNLTVDAQGRITAASSGTAPVTSVTGTAPVVSSGGTTPAISMPKATSSVDGYLSSTDWTTFNSKGNGTVTSVGGTGTVNGITLTGTVTSSGNLTLGGTLSGVNLATQVTGTLPIANGGTGQTTAAAAFNALNPMTTTGDIIYEDSGGVAARLGIGTTGQVLSVSGGKPAWTTPSTGASVTVGTSPPVSPNAGDFWWDSESGKLKIYYNDGTSVQWVDAFTGTSAGGAGGGVLMVAGGGGFSTTSTTMVDVPNLTAALTEGTWAYTVDLSFQSTGTAGSRFCMTYTGSFSSIEYTQSAMESATADGATTRQTTSGSTSGTSYGATASVPLYGRMFGTIVVTGAGNLKVQISKTTSGTATTYPSVMTYYRVA